MVIGILRLLVIFFIYIQYMVRNTLLLLLCLSTITAYTQSVAGSWFGKADVIAQGVNNNYLTELVLKQKGDVVEGTFSYYFKDVYQSFVIKGTYNKNTREVTIKNVPLIFYKSSNTRTSVECPMTFNGILTVNKLETTIMGSFITADSKYKYTCPEVRVNLHVDNEVKSNTPEITKASPIQKFWKPQEEDVVVINTKDHKAVVVNRDNSIPGPKAIGVNISVNPNKDLIAQFEKRKNVINSKDIILESDSVRISFYDNGEIDGDTISVFLNKQPILVKHGLTTKAMNLYFALDSLMEYNELSMFAENLGKYPPNTALMVLTDGVNRYEIFMSSSMVQNATVRLKRKKGAATANTH